MTLKFERYGYRWVLRSGFPPMGSTEVQEPTFVEALRSAATSLQRLSDHELASWVVARLNFITSGRLPFEGEVFAHDTNEFGYKFKVVDDQNATVGHGAVVIHVDRTYFASVAIAVDNLQSLFVRLLVEFPEELDVCEINVLEPGTRKHRSYGWDGYSLRSRTT